LAVALLLAAGVGLAAETSPAWQLEWDKTIASAEKEGAMSIYIFDADDDNFADRRPADKLFNEIFGKASK
jgi:hypothetical protein